MTGIRFLIALCQVGHIVNYINVIQALVIVEGKPSIVDMVPPRAKRFFRTKNPSYWLARRYHIYTFVLISALICKTGSLICG
jgi:hypothetical protein